MKIVHLAPAHAYSERRATRVFGECDLMLLHYDFDNNTGYCCLSQSQKLVDEFSFLHHQSCDLSVLSFVSVDANI